MGRLDMQPRVLVFTGGDDRALAAALGELDGVRVSAPRERYGALAEMAQADVLISADHAWGEDFAAALRGAESTRWVQLLTAGFDRLERLGLPRRVTVSTIGDAGAAIVAEHAIFLLLALLRKGPDLVRAQQRAEWAFRAMAAEVRSLRDKHVAVLGFGHIGRAVAALLDAFGAQVTGIARSARRDQQGREIAALADLPHVLARCDALIVTLPLNAATQELLDANTFARMQRGSMLVNVSRGRVIVTDALVAALENGTLAGAALDVTDPEPLPSGHPLWSLPNVIITPHVAWAGGGASARRAVEARVVENVRRFVRGEPLCDVVSIEFEE